MRRATGRLQASRNVTSILAGARRSFGAGITVGSNNEGAQRYFARAGLRTSRNASYF